MSQIHPMFQKYANGSSAATNPPTAQPAKPANDFIAEFDAALNEGELLAKGDAKAKAEESSKRDGEITRNAVSSRDIYQDQRGEVMTDVPRGPRIDSVPVDSPEAYDALLLAAKDGGCKNLPSASVLEREVAVKKAEARSRGSVTPTSIRTAKLPDGRYAHDLCDTEGHVVIIGPGTIEVTTEQVAKFRRPLGQGSLPLPIIPDTPKEALRIMRDYYGSRGIEGAMGVIIPVTATDSIRPDTPHPNLEFFGPAGSGKTTAANEHIQIIDPTAAGTMPNTPITEENIAAACAVRLVIGVDNSGGITKEAENVLCMTATGVTAIKRKFQTQNETVNQPIFAPVVMTGVTSSIKASDLKTRAFSVAVKPRGAYRSEDDVKAEFLEKRPLLLGCIYRLLASGLELLPCVVNQVPWNHRLVGNAQLGEAILQACGYEPGKFVALLDAYRRSGAVEAAASDPLVKKLLDTLKAWAKHADPGNEMPPFAKWEASKHAGIRRDDGSIVVVARPSELMGKLRNCVRLDYPSNDRHMDEALLRVTPTLRDLGIETEKFGKGGSRPYWQFFVAPGVLADAEA